MQIIKIVLYLLHGPHPETDEHILHAQIIFCKTMYAFIFSPMQAASLSRLTGPHFITLITFREENKWRIIMQFSPACHCFPDVNILLGILLPNILKPCSSLGVRDDISHVFFPSFFVQRYPNIMWSLQIMTLSRVWFSSSLSPTNGPNNFIFTFFLKYCDM
jgi:hypothetical protein